MLKPPECNGCAIQSFSNGFSLPEGNGTNGVAIVGEACGYTEYLEALPFRPHAQAGSKLEEVFKLVSKDLSYPVTRSQFLICNLVQCNPPGDKLAGEKYEAEAINHCNVYLDRILSNFCGNGRTGGRVILALGNLPLKYLCGVSGVAKEKQSISHLRGFVFQSKYGLVVPSYHPSFIKRGNNHLTPLLVEDMKKALALAKGVYSSHIFHPSYKPPEYQTSPGLDEARSFYYRVKDSPKLVLSYDIETQDTPEADEDERDELENTDITQIQFSLRKHEGIAFPYEGEYQKIAQDILALNNVKANHNTWNFDNVILSSKGIRVNGLTHDTLWMHKHWHPRLPRGLQSVASNFRFPFPWKHMYGSNLAYYGAADVDAVQWIISELPRLMQARGVWQGYRDHVLRLHPILERASRHGIPVSEENRAALEIDFRARRGELNKEIQKIIPDELRNIRPKRKLKDGSFDYGYIREPKIVSEELYRYTELSKKLQETGKRVCTFEEYLYRKHNICVGEFEEKSLEGVKQTTQRWCVVEPFKASSQQLIRYLKWKQKGITEEVEKLIETRDREFGGRNPELTERIHDLGELAKDYEVPKKLRTNKDTTDKKELEEMYLNTGDPILEMVVKIRSYDTNINNYLKNWIPGRDGRVHPTFGFTAPTGQINTWRPNGQNVSKHTEFGNEFRGIIEAPTGYCFVELDKRSFHVATMGYVANDKNYIRFSQIDPHSILGSYIDPSVIGQSISLKWSDDEIKLAVGEFKKRCKEIKAKDPLHGIDVRQELAKPTVLGNQLELGAKKLQRQNRRFIQYVTRREREYYKGEGYSAEELQGILNQLFNRVTLVKGAIKEKAHIEKFLIDEWYRIQYFYDVFNFSWNKSQRKWNKKDGEGAREPIAFRVQGTAFGMITDELIECNRQGICEEHNFIMTIHDSLIFMPEVVKRDRCIEQAYTIMNKPCSRLVNEATGPEGLRVGVEVSAGFNWKGYNEEQNPRGMQEIKIS